MVNAAGLGAPALASVTEGYREARVPQLHYVKRNYFSYPGRPAVSQLIYPVPVDGGLGTSARGGNGRHPGDRLPAREARGQQNVADAGVREDFRLARRCRADPGRPGRDQPRGEGEHSCGLLGQSVSRV